MSFNDIFKSSYLENVSAIDIPDMIIALVLAFLVGLFIYFIYQKTYRGVMYSASFGVTLVALTMITTLVILAVTSNAVLSLGMVGALSIVRFRTAIKEPMEIVFLFWSLAVGIVIGAGMIPLAVIGSLIIGIILVIFANRKIRNTPYILIVNCNDENAEKSALELIGKSVGKYMVKSKSVNASGIELTTEVRIKNNSTDFVNRVNELTGVSAATLVSYNGEYMA